MSTSRLTAFLFCCTCLFPTHVLAHEYWLEPITYAVKPGDKIEGHLRNGQNFKGITFTYIPDHFEQFSVQSPTETIQVPGRAGNSPALSVEVTKAGLHSASYQGTFDRITFTNREKLEAYAAYEGLGDVLERHSQRGLDDNRLEEQYARCAKALFQVGPLQDPNVADRLTGLKFEIVAEKNPYALGPEDRLPVRLYWQGEPVAQKQIRFFQFNNDLQTGIVITDENGRATIPLAGGGKFMLNAVNIYPGDEDPDTELAEWVSFWASLTFGLADSDEVLNRK